MPFVCLPKSKKIINTELVTDTQLFVEYPDSDRPPYNALHVYFGHVDTTTRLCDQGDIAIMYEAMGLAAHTPEVPKRQP